MASASASLRVMSPYDDPFMFPKQKKAPNPMADLGKDTTPGAGTLGGTSALPKPPTPMGGGSGAGGTSWTAQATSNPIKPATPPPQPAPPAAARPPAPAPAVAPAAPAARPTYTPTPVPTGGLGDQLAGQVGNAYMDLFAGNNPAFAQAERAATTNLDNLLKASQASLTRNATLMGLLPGDPRYTALKNASEAPLLSQSSNILGALTQKNLDDQQRTLVSGGNFAQGQQQVSDSRHAQEEDSNRFAATFGASEEQRALDNLFRTDRAGRDDFESDRNFGASEEQRLFDNTRITGRDARSDLESDRAFGSSEEQRILDNLFRKELATEDNSRFDLTFGASEEQRGFENERLTGRDTRSDLESDRAFMSEEEQRALDNLFRTDRAGRADLESDRSYLSEEDQRILDNIFRTDRAGRDDLEADRTFAASEEQRAFGNQMDLTRDEFERTFAWNDAAHNQTMDAQRQAEQERQANIATFTSIINNPDIYSAGQIGEAKIALASLMQGRVGGLGWNTPDPTNAQQTLDELTDHYKVYYGLSDAEARAKAQETAQALDAYDLAMLQTAKTKEQDLGVGGTPTTATGSSDFFGALTPEGDWALDDTIADYRKGINNIAEGNILTGGRQVLTGAGSALGNAASDVGTGVKKGVKWLLGG